MCIPLTCSSAVLASIAIPVTFWIWTGHCANQLTKNPNLSSCGALGTLLQNISLLRCTVYNVVPPIDSTSFQPTTNNYVRHLLMSINRHTTYVPFPSLDCWDHRQTSFRLLKNNKNAYTESPPGNGMTRFALIAAITSGTTTDALQRDCPSMVL